MLAGRGQDGHPDPLTAPLHPILAAAYFVLFLFASNLEDQLTLGPLWVPLALSAGGAIVALVIGAVLLRDPRRGALLATVAVLAFFTFGHARILTVGLLPSREVLVVAYAAAAVALGWLVWRGGSWVAPLTRVLNVGFAILVVLNAIPVVASALDDPTAGRPAPTPAFDAGAAESREKPDIYYLIFDRYGNEPTLESVYGYDNEPFLDDLRDRGFFVAENAWANYFKTAFSLASSLDMNFLPGDELRAEAQPGLEMRPVHTMVNGRLTGPTTLKALGYQYVHIGSWFAPTRINTGADVNLNFSDDLEFRTALAETTMLSLFESPGTELDGRNFRDPTVARAYHDFVFRNVVASADRAGPTFVFGHILLPHPPYVYDENGDLPNLEDGRGTDAHYIDQLRYTNQRILDTIDAILEASDGDPIIIVQGDEGPFPDAYAKNENGFQWLEATPEQVAQKFGILFAVRTPGVDATAAGFHDRSTPVNLFRILMNAYFGADLPLLPDSTFLSPNHARPYDFVEVDRDADGMPVMP